MPVVVRSMRDDEARMFLEIQRAAVRGLATEHYPRAIIEEWAELPITDEALERFNENRDCEVRLIAEVDGEPVGIGALVVENSELRACYVLRSVARQGVGTAIVREIERLARERGLTQLNLHASLNAEAFYLALGYTAVKRTEHVLRSGGRMQSVEMRKDLATMPLLFSYGTLQQDDVQISTFGRVLQGSKDELPGFELSSVPIDDPQIIAAIGRTHHANVTFNGRSDSRVRGTVFDVTDAELAAADRFEQRFDYKRIDVTLASGKQAWIYVHAGRPT